MAAILFIANPAAAEEERTAMAKYREGEHLLILGAYFSDADAEIRATVDPQPEASITGRAFVGDNERKEAESTDDLLAPLPNLRLMVFYELAENLAAIANVDWISANIDEWDGTFTYLHARLHRKFNRHFGIAAGYQFTDVDLTRETRRKETEHDIEFSGPRVQMTYVFLQCRIEDALPRSAGRERVDPALAAIHATT